MLILKRHKPEMLQSDEVFYVMVCCDDDYVGDDDDDDDYVGDDDDDDDNDDNDDNCYAIRRNNFYCFAFKARHARNVSSNIFQNRQLKKLIGILFSKWFNKRLIIGFDCNKTKYTIC